VLKERGPPSDFIWRRRACCLVSFDDGDVLESADEATEMDDASDADCKEIEQRDDIDLLLMLPSWILLEPTRAERMRCALDGWHVNPSVDITAINSGSDAKASFILRRRAMFIAVSPCELEEKRKRRSCHCKRRTCPVKQLVMKMRHDNPDDLGTL
jgi:hypothetical protein